MIPFTNRATAKRGGFHRPAPVERKARALLEVGWTFECRVSIDGKRVYFYAMRDGVQRVRYAARNTLNQLDAVDRFVDTVDALNRKEPF